MPLRAKGISTLIACQNEEATVGWCILSFLDFSDEIIVVDNGSTDASKEICREMARRYPEKVSFHDVPHLKDLYENRQYAFERSHYNWIVRADADYICYTDGEYDCRTLRDHLLSRPRFSRPEIYHLIMPNLYGDYWHTGSVEVDGDDAIGGVGGRKRLPIVANAMPRVYRWFPRFRFDRLGRKEGVRIPRLMRRLVRNVYWQEPIFMHCSIKSDVNLLYRSERTNWRELGDYERYPTLEVYLKERLQEEYGTDDLAMAEERYVERALLPYLTKYDPDSAYPYPSLVLRAMEENPVFRIVTRDGRTIRERVDAADSTLVPSVAQPSKVACVT